MKVYKVSHPSGIVRGEVKLDGSKSISNRILIIRALAGVQFDIKGLSTSDDTTILDQLLQKNDSNEYYVGHAGTTFRFLTAYLSIKDGEQILTGSERMLQRPIGPLVDALRQIGAQIDYMGVEGYPPLRITSPKNFKKEVSIKANISSQYLTALILIAPTLPQGLKINLLGDLVSESYLQMTIDTVSEFGIQVTRKGKSILISPQSYQVRPFTVEADWSAASYYFSLAALAKESEIELDGLFENSTQGDSAIVDFAEQLGVDSRCKDQKWKLGKTDSGESFDYDFINQPDIAQTIAVICAAKGIAARFTGLQTLSIKETDRITAIDNELKKVGCKFEQIGDTEYYKVSGEMKFDGVPRFATYKDHRMAMAFAPLALFHPIEIEEPDVVGKSYPAFWDDLRKLGFSIEELPLTKIS